MLIAVFYGAPIFITSLVGQLGMWKILVPAVAVAVAVMETIVHTTRKEQRKYVLLGAFLLASASILLVYFGRGDFWILLVGMVAFMSSYLTSVVMVASEANEGLGVAIRGTANGIFNACQYSANFIGAIVTGALWGISPLFAFLCAMIIGLMGFFAIIIHMGRSHSPCAESKAEK